MATCFINPLAPIKKDGKEYRIDSIHHNFEHPTVYLEESHEFLVLEGEVLKEWMRQDTNVDRLNTVHKHLWLAGLAQPARSIHEQVVVQRQIVITERADLHLTWRDYRIFIKPLPDYLVNPDAWQNYLLQDAHLYGTALGLLWSWLWLIRTKSDFHLAHSKHLLPEHLSWSQWNTVCRLVICNADRDLINPRYRHGELAISRLNWLYRFCSNTMSVKNFMRGYMYGYHGYSTWFRRNTTWLAGSLVYIALVLTAMQVGMLTDRLQHNDSFQAVCVGFTVFSITAPLVAVTMVFLIIVLVFIFNLVDRLRHRKNHVATLPDSWQIPALKPHKH